MLFVLYDRRFLSKSWGILYDLEVIDFKMFNCFIDLILQVLLFRIVYVEEINYFFYRSVLWSI